MVLHTRSVLPQLLENEKNDFWNVKVDASKSWSTRNLSTTMRFVSFPSLLSTCVCVMLEVNLLTEMYVMNGRTFLKIEVSLFQRNSCCSSVLTKQLSCRFTWRNANSHCNSPYTYCEDGNYMGRFLRWNYIFTFWFLLSCWKVKANYFHWALVVQIKPSIN